MEECYNFLSWIINVWPGRFKVDGSPPPLKVTERVSSSARNIFRALERIKMKGFKDNIEKMTLDNTDFRHVLYTAKHSQLVLMSLLPSEEIGMEVHPDNDQFFRFEKGQGKVIIDGNEYEVADGDAVVVPAGANHNVINVSDAEPLKLYTIYSPAHHKDGVIRATKAEAQADSPEYDGTNSE
jgi:mannose-6-phosphate isomerase-like protein (cupin superfamily)